MKLRPYQLDAESKLRAAFSIGCNRPILCLPTGAGKTVTFSSIVNQAIEKGRTVGLTAHRTELIEQAYNTMQAYGVQMSGVRFGMVQTYVRSPHKIPACDLWIIDECHIGNFRKFLDFIPNTSVIGATATPLSASKRMPLNQEWEKVISPVQIADLIDQGYLSKPVYNIAKMELEGLQIGSNGDYTGSSSTSEYSRLFNIQALQKVLSEVEGKSIIFCASVEMVERVAEMIPGSYYVHSKMSIDIRRAVIAAYKSDPKGIIVNCGILTAGFDDPDIRNVIVYRATTSLTLWLQMVGRGSRVTSDKSAFNIYDLGNNVKTLGAWHMERNWEQLFNDQGKKSKEAGAAPMKNCVNCEALIYASATKCLICNTLQPVQTKEAAPVSDWERLYYGQGIPDYLQKPWNEMTVQELIQRAQYGSPNVGRPYKMGWVISQIKQRENSTQLLQELARIKGYKQGWVNRQLTT